MDEICEQSIRYAVLGIEISGITRKSFFDEIDRKLQANSRYVEPLFVVTVNPEIVVQSITDSEFRRVLWSSAINTADGVGISWAVRRMYGAKIERITGSDSLEEICQLAARHGSSVFFYGARPGVAEKTAAILSERIQGLIVAGSFSPDRPDLPLEEHPESVQEALRSAAIVFVALGAPHQEKWIHRNIKNLPSCKLIIGIGGSFDFIAGTAKRAPLFFRRTGTEWIYRLVKQPSRWRRMLRLPLFALNVLLMQSKSVRR